MNNQIARKLKKQIPEKWPKRQAEFPPVLNWLEACLLLRLDDIYPTPAGGDAALRTLRKMADLPDVGCVGGHMRYMRDELLEWMKTRGRRRPSAA